MYLSAANIKLIRQARTQQVLGVLMQVIVIGVILGLIIPTMNYYFPQTQAWNIYPIILAILIIIYWIAYAAYPFWLDEKGNEKIIIKQKLIEKKEDVRWAYHAHPIVSFMGLKPKLIIYSLILEENSIFVEKDFFESVEIEDTIEISMTVNSKLVIEIKKV